MEDVTQKKNKVMTGTKLVFGTILYYIVSYILVYTFKLPRIILYGGDILNALCWICALFYNKGNTKIKRIYSIMFLFICIGVFSGIVNHEKKSLLIWGIRNNVRFFTFFYSCVTFLNKNDYLIIMKFIKLIFWISVPLCTIERFGVHYSNGTIVGDMIGGIFWNFSGCNTPLNVILIIYSLHILLKFFLKEEKMIVFLVTIMASFYMAALAELKIYLIEFIVMLLLVCIYQRISIKMIISLISGAIILSTFSTYFIAINQNGGNNYADNFSLSGLIEYATRDSGYNGEGDLNRFTGISTISNTIFENDIFSKLFGIGIGNAEYTNFFVSPFYNKYYYLNYQYFHDIWLYIENGAIGIITYLMIFIEAYKNANKNLKDIYYKNFIKILIIMMLILFVYNITLRNESGGFILYMFLAFPFLKDNNIKKKGIIKVV